MTAEIPRNSKRELCEFGGKGKVWSFTTIYKGAPAGFEKYVPYTIALIKLDEGPMLLAQLTDLDSKWVEKEVKVNGETLKMQEQIFDIEIGMSVEMVTRKLRTDGDRGTIVYGYKFRPPLKRNHLSQKAESV